jgi:hypothetical protein
MRWSLLILAALAGCSPNLGQISVNISPECGLGDRAKSVTVAGGAVTTRCDTTISIDGKADPVVTASPVIAP